MSNEEIYALFRSQDKYLKFSDFIENCIEWTYEEQQSCNEAKPLEDDNGLGDTEQSSTEKIEHI